jgi:hypothetical protein
VPDKGEEAHVRWQRDCELQARLGHTALACSNYWCLAPLLASLVRAAGAAAAMLWLRTPSDCSESVMRRQREARGRGRCMHR